MMTTKLNQRQISGQIKSQQFTIRYTPSDTRGGLGFAEFDFDISSLGAKQVYGILPVSGSTYILHGMAGGTTVDGIFTKIHLYVYRVTGAYTQPMEANINVLYSE